MNIFIPKQIVELRFGWNIMDSLDRVSEVEVGTVDVRMELREKQVGMLQCTISYDTPNTYSVLYDMGSPNLLSQ